MPNATLKHVRFHDYGNGRIHASGHIHGDDKKRFPDGTLVTTSRVAEWDETTGILTTKNSIYKVETPVIGIVPNIA